MTRGRKAIMRIHITYTGGTIGMVDSPNGLVPGADLRGWLQRLLTEARLDPSLFSFTELDPLIDSSNATPDNWQTMVNDLRAHRDDADTFVVLHGTDTMAYSSAALSYALTDFGKPVIFTGSQHPLGMLKSDAAANVSGAVTAAMQAVESGRFQGVGLFFGQHLFAGNRVSKSSSWAFEGFSAPTVGPLACAGTPWHWFSDFSGDFAGDSAPIGSTAGCGWPSPLPYARHDVAVIDMAPGISAARLAAMLDPRPEAVLLRAYGVGNVPSDEPGLTDAIADVLHDGVPVVIASQCQQAEVLLGHYETGDAIARAGAIGSGDMTLEATYAKIMFLLSQGVNAADFGMWMRRSIAGEISPSSL